MDRRALLIQAGIVAAAVGVGAAGAVGVEEYRIHFSKQGWAVGTQRPAHLSANLNVWRLKTDQPIAALTFDDGPDPRYTPGVLDALSKAAVPATFFMMGKNVAKHNDLVKQVAERHEIGNHTYTHPDLSRAVAAQARAELGRTHELIEKVAGKAPTMFRPPYGRFSGATEMISAGMGYDTILWSNRVDTTISAADNTSALGHSVKPGSIVLAHDGGTLNNHVVVKTLPSLIERLQGKGIKLVGMSEMLSTLRVQAAETDPGDADVASNGPLQPNRLAFHED